ncbi:MAG TPA: hypothetical protein VFT14_00260 [Solirubrobacterales bacterium]|nr:hypothetical protein [Solirubrobacterales bacterium]
MADLLLLAHLSHWSWALYVPPVLVVLFSIVKTVIAERRGDREG